MILESWNWMGKIGKRKWTVLIAFISSLAFNSYAVDGLPDFDLLAFPEDGCFDLKEDGLCNWIYIDEPKCVQEWKGGTRNSQGVLTLPNGTKYVGMWIRGKPHGYGTYILSDGSSYVGEWKNGLPHGQGAWILASGKQYVGSIKEGRASGLGRYTFTDGSTYSGEFVNGQLHGKGRFTTFEGSVFSGIPNRCQPKLQKTKTSLIYRVYVGEWKNNRPWDIATYTKEGKAVTTPRKNPQQQGLAVLVGCWK